MKIFESNGYLINSKDVYFHDSVLEKLIFDKSYSKLRAELEKNAYTSYNIIEFVNTVGFEMTSCNFWGISQNVLDFEYIEKDMRELLPRLYNAQKYDSTEPLFKLAFDVDYMEVKMTFVSGDILTVVCEYVDII